MSEVPPPLDLALYSEILRINEEVRRATGGTPLIDLKLSTYLARVAAGVDAIPDTSLPQVTPGKEVVVDIFRGTLKEVEASKEE